MITGHAKSFWPEGGTGIEFVGGKSDTWDGTGSTRNISLTNLTGGLSAAPSENDFVVLSLTVIQSTSGDMNLAISGYTEHCDLYPNDSVDSFAMNFGVFSKFMGASPDTSVTIQTIPLATGNNNWAHVRITVWRGVNLTTPMDVPVVTNNAIDTANSVTPAITPVTAGAMVVDTAAACCGNGLNVQNMTNPGAFDPFLMSIYAKGVSCMGGKLWPGAGAMGPYTHGGGSDSTACWAALNMALRPA